jgi:hypothetical protein
VIVALGKIAEERIAKGRVQIKSLQLPRRQRAMLVGGLVVVQIRWGQRPEKVVIARPRRRISVIEQGRIPRPQGMKDVV